MNLLSPSFAAAVANGVYAIRGEGIANLRSIIGLLGCDPDFSVQDPAGGLSHPFVKSTTGSAPDWLPDRFFSPIRSNFGYVATGNGKWAKHLILVTRGTDIPADWISNINIALGLGPAWIPVHSGFLRVWTEMRDFVHRAIDRFRPEYIHCIGHSLGGALANLNALYLAHEGHNVALYTFGSPRVGATAFAVDISKRLEGRVKRVHHPADPVPMIPLIPFMHAPLDGGIRLDAASFWPVSPSAHNMEDSYKRTIDNKKYEDWAAMEKASTTPSGYQIDSWLQQAARQKGGFILGSAALLERISLGLVRVITKAAATVFGAALGPLSGALTTAFTALDIIAWLLARAATIVRQIADEIAGLVKAIFGFLGRVTNDGVKLTQMALRWVLDLLFSFLVGQAQRALKGPWSGGTW